LPCLFVVGVPNFTPASGAFASGQLITISSPSSSYICYRVDGTDPGCGVSIACATGSVAIVGASGTATIATGHNQLKAVGCDAAFQASALVSKTYTIGSFGPRVGFA
jgi:hypothetical protein